MSGRARGGRIPGITVGLAIDERRAFALEGRLVGRIFSLAGTPAQATLHLNDGNRVVTGRPSEITEALIGIPLTPDRLLLILNGCLSDAGPEPHVEAVGEWLRVTTADVTVYLMRQDAGWVIKGGVFDAFTVDYQQRRGRVPTRIRVAASANQSQPASITFAIRESTVNPALPPALFEPRVPAGAVATTVDELRNSQTR